jgi:hypothetical protein
MAKIGNAPTGLANGGRSGAGLGPARGQNFGSEVNLSKRRGEMHYNDSECDSALNVSRLKQNLDSIVEKGQNLENGYNKNDKGLGSLKNGPLGGLKSGSINNKYYQPTPVDISNMNEVSSYQHDRNKKLLNGENWRGNPHPVTENRESSKSFSNFNL